MSHGRALSFVIAFAALVASACDSTTVASDCPGGCPGSMECRDGECVNASDSCNDVVCGEGQRCVDGTCRAVDLCDGVECIDSSLVCNLRTGECVSGDVDADGDTVTIAEGDCDDSDANRFPGATEACNGLDDDCDEDTIDGADECDGRCCGVGPVCAECCDDTQCGAGGWSCADGACYCEGRSDGDTCFATVDCTPGDTEDRSEGCGFCGTHDQWRNCSPEGLWNDWSGWDDCTGEGTCSPGQTDTNDCGNCGTQSRTCTDACTWGDWGSCTDEGECSPGLTYSDTGACGSCDGSRTRTVTCSSGCAWVPGAWGLCMGDISCSGLGGDLTCPRESGFRVCPTNPEGAQGCTCSTTGTWIDCAPGCFV